MKHGNQILDSDHYSDSSECNEDELKLKAEQFFEQLNIKEIQGDKGKCSKCGSKKYMFCLKCGDYISDKSELPNIELGVELIILHHIQENYQKSSALPLQFISSPNQVIFYPTQFDQLKNLNKQLYVLYPNQNSKTLDQLTQTQFDSIDNIIAIDSTWSQTNQILESITSLSPIFIKLQTYSTCFWRYQHHSKRCLATCEAIYYFYKEYNKRKGVVSNIDNLLMFYKHNFQQINKHTTNVYKKMQEKKIKTKQKDLLKTQ